MISPTCGIKKQNKETKGKNERERERETERQRDAMQETAY